jgi:hypothetical protein
MAGFNSHTLLLLPFDGTDGQTSATDSTGRHGTINFNGAAQLDTAFKKWGTAALLLDGNGDYLDIPDSDDWDLMGGLVTDGKTIDFWVRHVDHDGSEPYICQSENANNYWSIYHVDGQGLFFYTIGATYSTGLTGGGEITDTSWHHIMLCRVPRYVGGSWKFDMAMYKDGQQVNWAGSQTADYLKTFAGSLLIGKDINVFYFNGSIDELRIHNSNYFNAHPNVGLSDTIVVPTKAYSKSAIRNFCSIT